MRELDEKIDELVKGTASRFEKLEKLIFNEVMNYLSDRVQVREQRITFDAQNYGVISSIDSLLSRFSSAIQNIGKYIIRGIGSVMGLTTDQLSKIDVRAIKTGATVTDELLRHSATVINKNLTLEPLFLDIKQQAIALMADPKGIDLVELRRALRSKVVDNRLAQRYFSRWTHDLYSQMQRVGANRIRLDLGLKYAVYQGGLIKTSRDFCEDRNGKCFSDDEIMKWESLNWEGKPETGYNALIDCGGYNCRHRLDWVSDQMARRMRPDLFDGRNKKEKIIKDNQDEINSVEVYRYNTEKREDRKFNTTGMEKNPNMVKFYANDLQYAEKYKKIFNDQGEFLYDAKLEVTKIKSDNLFNMVDDFKSLNTYNKYVTSKIGKQLSDYREYLEKAKTVKLKRMWQNQIDELLEKGEKDIISSLFSNEFQQLSDYDLQNDLIKELSSKGFKGYKTRNETGIF